MAKKSSNITYGSLAEAIDQIGAFGERSTALRVLRLVQLQINTSQVRVSQDLRRASLEASSGKLVAVRVTCARQLQGGISQFRLSPRAI
jgi:hypothetical protein